MIGAIIGAALSAIPALYKTFSGASQIKEAKQGLADLQRPEYKVPAEILKANTMAQTAYADPYMPGQGVMMDRVEQQAANAYGQSVQAGNPFATLSSNQAIAQQGLQNIGITAANYQTADAQRYAQMLQTVANYRDQEYQMNQFAPYAEKSQEYRDMFGAGNKNLYSGIDQLAGTGANVLSAISLSTLNKSTTSSTPSPQDMLKILEQYQNAKTTGTSMEFQQQLGQGLDNFNAFRNRGI